MCLQKAAEENAKMFPACWRTKVKPVEHQADANNVTLDHGTGVITSNSAAPSSTESRTSSKLLSPVNDTSPRTAPDCGTSSSSPVQVKTESLSCVAVNESETNNNSCTSARKMNLDDYRRHRIKPAVTTEDHHFKSTIAHNHKESHRSEEDHLCSDSAAEIANSSSCMNKSDAKPRIKLKIGSEVVVKTFCSRNTQGSDACTSNKMQNVVCNGSSLPQTSDVPKVCVNGDASEKLNLLNVSSLPENNGCALSDSSSCEEGSSDLEPPAKHARMSLEPRFPSAAEYSACRWVHHD